MSNSFKQCKNTLSQTKTTSNIKYTEKLGRRPSIFFSFFPGNIDIYLNLLSCVEINFVKKKNTQKEPLKKSSFDNNTLPQRKENGCVTCSYFSLSRKEVEDNMSKEQMKQQYDNLKTVLSRIQGAFVEGVADVTELLNEWKGQLSQEFLVALSSRMANTQEKIKQI
ncbi:hypothetical protein RFI_15270, partial [Reticulomyxa filosa]